MDSESLVAKLKPPGLGRSVSHQLDEKNVDSQKLLKFRLWLDSYQKWKLLHSVPLDESNCENPDIPPVKSIIQFLKTDGIHDLMLLEVMKLHDRRCARRIIGLQLLNDFSNVLQNTVLQSFVLGGVLCQGDIMSQRIELSATQAKQLLFTQLIRRINYLITQINHMTHQARNLHQILGASQSSKLDLSVIESLKQVEMTISELNQLMSVQGLREVVSEEYLSSIIQTGLLSLVFVGLD